MRYMNAPARAAFGYEEGGVRGQKVLPGSPGLFPSPASSARTTCPVSRDSRPGKTRMSAFTGGSSSGTKSFSGTPACPAGDLSGPGGPGGGQGERRTRAAGDGGPSAVGREPGGRHPGHPGAAGGLLWGGPVLRGPGQTGGRGPFRRPSSGSLLPSRPGGNAAAQTLEGAGWLEHLKARHLVACHDVEQLQQVFPEKYRDMRARGYGPSTPWPCWRRGSSGVTWASTTPGSGWSAPPCFSPCPTF